MAVFFLGLLKQGTCFVTLPNEKTWVTVLGRNCTSIWKHLLCTMPDNHVWESSLLLIIICYCLFSYLYSPRASFRVIRGTFPVSMNFLSCNRRGKSVAVKESEVRLRASTVTQITFNSFVWNYCDTRFATPSNQNSPAIISWMWIGNMNMNWRLIGNYFHLTWGIHTVL